MAKRQAGKPQADTAEVVQVAVEDAIEATPEDQFRAAIQVLAHRVAMLIQADRADGDVRDHERGRVFPTQLLVRDALAGARPPASDVVPWSALPPRLVALAEALELNELEVCALLIAAAPAVDARFEHFFVVLNNETSTLGPTVGTLLRLAGLSPYEGQARATFGGQGTIRALGLVNLGPATRPLLTQVVTVPERVVSYLLGDDEVDATLARSQVHLTRAPLPAAMLPEVEGPADWPVVLRARAGTAAIDQARHIAWQITGDDALVFDGGLLKLSDETTDELARILAREVTLSRQMTVVDMRSTDVDAPIVPLLNELDHIGVPAIIIVDGRRSLGSWDRRTVTLATPSVTQREEWWRLLAPNSPPEQAQVTTHLDPDDIIAARDGGTSAALHRVSGQGRRSRVQTITPAITLSDVVFTPRCAEQMRMLVGRVRNRGLVLDEWGMRPGGARGRGVTALFAGPSGTGKTMSAEALAGELGVPLFFVDLASVIDKYIGETEKNLEDVFRTVENEDGVLLFDEADALFGKRSDVSDARDRYANIEVAYLLQRIEAFDGLAILTTNLRANLDEAFQRRLDMIVDFPEPTADVRATLWDVALGRFASALSEQDRLDLATLDIAGGTIRSAVVTAAYLAADESATLNRGHVLRGVKEEWKKAGRLQFPTDTFASWGDPVSDS